jgi:hypothetical protein
MNEFLMPENEMKKDDVTYVPNDFVNNLSVAALGVACFAIAKGDLMPLSFGEIIRANRGASEARLFIIMQELIAKGFACEGGNSCWILTVPQPGGQIEILITQDEHEMI